MRTDFPLDRIDPYPPLKVAWFIGGPRDGEFERVPLFEPDYWCVDSPWPRDRKWLVDTPLTITVDQHRYAKTEWEIVDGTRHVCVYRHESLPRKQLLEFVMRGYAQRPRTDERCAR